MASKDSYTLVTVKGKERVVAEFELQPPWRCPVKYDDSLVGLDEWQKLVLVGQTDALKHIANFEAKAMYGRAVVTDADIDTQKQYVVERFENNHYYLEVTQVCIVADRFARTAHLVVSLDGPSGQFHTSLEWLHGGWRIVPGTGEVPWAVLNAEEAFSAARKDGGKKLPVEMIQPVMHRLSATFLDP